MHYLVKRWWWSMTMIIEKREVKSVRYGRRKDITMISECHLDRDSLIMWVKWFRVWVSIYIKMVVNWFSIFWTSLCMSSRWVLISTSFVSYVCFEIGKNSNSIKAGKIRQIRFGLDGYNYEFCCTKHNSHKRIYITAA